MRVVDGFLSENQKKTPPSFSKWFTVKSPEIHLAQSYVTRNFWLSRPKY